MNLRKKWQAGARSEFAGDLCSFLADALGPGYRIWWISGLLGFIAGAFSIFVVFNMPVVAAVSLAGAVCGILFLGASLAGRERSDDQPVLSFMDRNRFAYVLLDENRRVIKMNDSARRLLGLADAEWKGCHWQTLLGRSGADPIPGDWPDEGIRFKGNGPNCMSHGLYYQLVPIHVGARSNFLLLLRDVGNIISDLQEKSDSSSLRTAACLATQIAHEVRNPIAAISGSAQLLGILNEKARRGDARSVKLLADEQNALCQSIVKESSRLDIILARFLSFSDLSEENLRAIMEVSENKEVAKYDRVSKV